MSLQRAVQTRRGGGLRVAVKGSGALAQLACRPVRTLPAPSRPGALAEARRVDGRALALATALGRVAKSRPDRPLRSARARRTRVATRSASSSSTRSDSASGDGDGEPAPRIASERFAPFLFPFRFRAAAGDSSRRLGVLRRACTPPFSEVSR